jgi:hypothetical protein
MQTGPDDDTAVGQHAPEVMLWAALLVASAEGRPVADLVTRDGHEPAVGALSAQGPGRCRARRPGPARDLAGDLPGKAITVGINPQAIAITP